MAGINFFAPFEGYYKQADFENKDRQAMLDAQFRQQQIDDAAMAQESRTTGYNLTTMGNRFKMEQLPVAQEGLMASLAMDALKRQANLKAYSVPGLMDQISTGQAQADVANTALTAGTARFNLSQQPLVQDTTATNNLYVNAGTHATADANTPFLVQNAQADAERVNLVKENELVMAPFIAESAFKRAQEASVLATGALGSAGTRAATESATAGAGLLNARSAESDAILRYEVTNNPMVRQALTTVSKFDRINATVMQLSMGGDMNGANRFAEGLGLELRWAENQETGVRELEAKTKGAPDTPSSWHRYDLAMAVPAYASALRVSHEVHQFAVNAGIRMAESQRKASESAAPAPAPSLTAPTGPGVSTLPQVPAGTPAPTAAATPALTAAQMEAQNKVRAAAGTPTLGAPGTIGLRSSDTPNIGPVDTSSFRGFLSSVLRPGIVDTPAKVAAHDAFLTKYEASNPRPRAGGINGVSDARALSAWTQKAEAAWLKQIGASK